MTIRMIATKAHTYAGKVLRAGASFEVFSVAHRKLLKALGRAQDAPAAEPAIEVIEAPVVVEAPKTAKPKRAYRRRDMSAES